MSQPSFKFSIVAVCGIIFSGAVMGGTWLQRLEPSSFFQVNASTIQPDNPEVQANPSSGKRHQLTYEEWVALLAREAKVAAAKQPDRLTILAGDSLSLWFPAEMLPSGFTWLNQGISGETSAGLLQRLRLFDSTQPDTILVMIGINDLIRGVRRETLLANHLEIVRHLKAAHPKARIVVQSILPHGSSQTVEQLTPPGRALPPWAERLAIVPNASIRELNRQLATMAEAEKVAFLDIHPYFADERGDLQMQLTTDGLHLNPLGYAVWRSQLEPLGNLPRTVSTSR